jgi:ZIP family zinc transporter
MILPVPLVAGFTIPEASFSYWAIWSSSKIKVLLRYSVEGIVASTRAGLPSTSQLSVVALVPLLAVFAGFFLYIGAADLLPESHHRHPTRWTTLMTLVGFLVLYLVIQIAK